MKKTKQDVIDEMILNKNTFVENISEDEKKEIDMYFDELIQEFGPMLDIFDKIFTDKKVLKNITTSIKNEIREEKWLEKMSDVVMSRQDVQEALKDLDK